VFNNPALYIAVQEVLSLYGTGRENGLTLNFGDGYANIVPIYCGNYLSYGVNQFPISGRGITDNLMKILNDKGFEFKTTAEREILRDIKEKLCYVSLNYEDDLKKVKESQNLLKKSYELPDGKIIDIFEERFKCTEIFFNPKLFGKEFLGIHELILKSVSNFEFDFRKKLLSNIVFSGGSTMFEGLNERLIKELKLLSPNDSNIIKTICFPERKYISWIGGSIFASLSTFKNLWVSKIEYDEYGPRIINTKCF
jgi:actin, other eukaryote